MPWLLEHTRDHPVCSATVFTNRIFLVHLDGTVESISAVLPQPQTQHVQVMLASLASVVHTKRLAAPPAAQESHPLYSVFPAGLPSGPFASVHSSPKNAGFLSVDGAVYMTGSNVTGAMGLCSVKPSEFDAFVKLPFHAPISSARLFPGHIVFTIRAETGLATQWITSALSIAPLPASATAMERTQWESALFTGDFSELKCSPLIEACLSLFPPKSDESPEQCGLMESLKTHLRKLDLKSTAQRSASEKLRHSFEAAAATRISGQANAGGNARSPVLAPHQWRRPNQEEEQEEEHDEEEDIHENEEVDDIEHEGRWEGEEEEQEDEDDDNMSTTSDNDEAGHAGAMDDHRPPTRPAGFDEPGHRLGSLPSFNPSQPVIDNRAATEDSRTRGAERRAAILAALERRSQVSQNAPPAPPVERGSETSAADLSEGQYMTFAEQDKAKRGIAWQTRGPDVAQPPQDHESELVQNNLFQLRRSMSLGFCPNNETVTIACCDRQWTVCKQALASASGFFRMMFAEKGWSEEASQNQCRLDTIRPEMLEAILSFIIRGECSISPADLGEMHGLSSMLQLPWLLHFCEVAVAKTLHVSTLREVLEAGRSLDCPSLRASALMLCAKAPSFCFLSSGDKQNFEKSLLFTERVLLNQYGTI